MSLESIRRTYGTDKKLEQRGVWVCPPMDDDVKIEFLIARQSRANRAWSNKTSRAFKEIQDKVDAGLLIDDQTIDKSIRIFCETNLLDWRGLTDGGRPIPYSPDEGYKLLKEFPDLYEFLNKVSMKRIHYQVVEEAEIEKKSATSSDGS